MKRRVVRTCYFRHRWTRWAYVRVDYNDGYPPERREDEQFRMCRVCGHQELREVACV